MMNVHNDIRSIILGEARQKQELIVLEQDVEVTSSLETAFINLEIFRLAQTITSVGTGVYTVDMSKITDGSIFINENNKVISITIPHAVLKYVNVDKEKTIIGDTERGLLAFSDITLTVEQQKELDESIAEAIRNELNKPDVFTKADETAVVKVGEVFQPLVNLKYSDYIVKALLQAGETNASD